MGRKLRDTVVVVTGASSGIGKATALAFAAQGATVVAIARRERALATLAEECESFGARVLTIPRDMADEAGVRSAAEHAVSTFGRIDVWVNNAAVSLFGRFEETPYPAYRRVLETNLMGYIHGARAAIPIFREQGSGVLINVSSVVGKIGQPYTSAYCVSKFGINGLGECLRMELMDAPDIHVCTVLAPSIDTPLFQHAANYTGWAVKPMDPVYDARQVADLILELAVHPRREAMAGAAGTMLHALRRMAPALAECVMARKVQEDHFQDRHSDSTEGNLFEPDETWTSVSGGWQTSAPQAQRRCCKIAATSMLTLVAAAAGVVLGWRYTRNH